MSDRNNSQEIRNDLQVVGSDLVERGRELVREGNARTFIIRNRDGEQLLASNLTIAAAIGGIALLFYLPIAIIVVIAAVILRLQIEILHEVDDEVEATADTPTILIDQSAELPVKKANTTPRKRRTRIADE